MVKDIGNFSLGSALVLFSLFTLSLAQDGYSTSTANLEIGGVIKQARDFAGPDVSRLTSYLTQRSFEKR